MMIGISPPDTVDSEMRISYKYNHCQIEFHIHDLFLGVDLANNWQVE